MLRSRMLVGVAVGALAVVAAGLAGCSEDLLDGFDSSVPTTVVEDSLTFDPADRIDVSTAAGEIEIVVTSAQSVTVSREFRYSGDDAPEATAEMRGTTLELSHDCSGFRQCSVGYRIETPAAVEVRSASASGSITISGITGAVDADTASGSITLAELAGDVTAASASGSITGTALASLTVEADTASGSIRLTFVAEPDSVEADSASGSVRVFVPGGPYDVDADSTSGSVDVEIATDPAATRRIVVTSTSGSVEVGPA